MYTRVVTFTGAKNIDGGLDYFRQQVVPVLDGQHGYRGAISSADRSGGSLAVVSFWDSEADRSASDSAMAKARQDAQQIVGGEINVENFEQVVEVTSKAPAPGMALYVTRVSMDPASVDDNIEFFNSTVLPMIQAQPGFCSLRNMIDRSSGRGATGTVFENRQALDAFDANQAGRRSQAEERGVHFEATVARELLFVDLK